MNNYQIAQTKNGLFYVKMIFTYSKTGRVSKYFKIQEEAQKECEKLNRSI